MRALLLHHFQSPGCGAVPPHLSHAHGGSWSSNCAYRIWLAPELSSSHRGHAQLTASRGFAPLPGCPGTWLPFGDSASGSLGSLLLSSVTYGSWLSEVVVVPGLTSSGAMTCSVFLLILCFILATCGYSLWSYRCNSFFNPSKSTSKYRILSHIQEHCFQDPRPLCTGTFSPRGQTALKFFFLAGCPADCAASEAQYGSIFSFCAGGGDI
jgi:hypothetical protein